MSIASRITSIEEHIGNAYDSINKFGVDTSVINRNIENIANVINDDIYDKLPKVTQSGAGFTLENVQNGQVDDFKMIGVDLYQNQLPSEYTAVEYLQSDNECFIDTGINADYKLSLKMKVACLDSVLEYMGAIKNIDNTNYIRHHLAFAPTAGNIIGIYYGQTNDQLILKEFDNNFHEFNLDIYNKKVSIDNNSTISISYNNFDVGINYYLFARNGSNIAISKGSYKIAYCKMYYEDNLVRDFAPCYRNSDNVAGLYDFVTNTFFTNQGTGTFTVGNNITLPNPDYPQEIKVVEGRQVINVSGKNLFDKEHEITGYVYDSSGNLVSSPNWNTNNEFKEINNNKISLSCKTTYPISFLLIEFDSNKNFIRRQQSTTTSYTFTLNNNTKYLRFCYLNNVGTYDIQIEESSTATDYEPYYNPISYNIDLHGKNVFNLEKYPFTPKVAYSSTGYQELNWTGYSGIKDYFPVNGNTTYSFSNSTGLDIYYGLVFYDKNKTIISNITAHTTTFTTPSNCEYIRFSIHTEELPTWVQIEEGSTTTNYEDYYDYKLAKMPNTDYKNRIYKNNGNWYFEENVRKYIFNSERVLAVNDYQSSSTGTSKNGTYSIVISDIGINVSNDKMMSTEYSYELNSNVTDNYSAQTNMTNNTFCLRQETNDRIYFKCSDYANKTASEISELIENESMYYALATPVTTQITNTTLINQLEAISVHTGTNIITISNDNNIIPEIEITRLKELEKLA